MARPSGAGMVARLGDHTVRIWRPVTASGAMAMDQRTYEPIAEVKAILNRNTAPVGDRGAGLAPIGRRRLYVAPLVDVQVRDVIELIDGPDAPQTLEVDEPPSRPRGHHTQLDCILWAGELPEIAES